MPRKNIILLLKKALIAYDISQGDGGKREEHHRVTAVLCGFLVDRLCAHERGIRWFEFGCRPEKIMIIYKALIHSSGEENVLKLVWKMEASQKTALIVYSYKTETAQRTAEKNTTESLTLWSRR